MTVPEFITSANLKFSDKFDYSQVTAYNHSTKQCITCPTHGPFMQLPYDHLRSRSGCPLCGVASAAMSKQHTQQDFITAARAVHGDKYDYSKTVYIAAKEKVTITCPIHGDFTQLVSGHLSGYGCKACTSYGKGRVSMEKPCSLYYLHIHDLNFYKLGITTRSLDERYRTKFDKEQFTVIFNKQYTTGAEAYAKEQELFALHRSSLYKGPRILHSGNTEIFTHDIFLGDYNEFIL